MNIARMLYSLYLSLVVNENSSHFTTGAAPLITAPAHPFVTRASPEGALGWAVACGGAPAD